MKGSNARALSCSDGESLRIWAIEVGTNNSDSSRDFTSLFFMARSRVQPLGQLLGMAIERRAQTSTRNSLLRRARGNIKNECKENYEMNTLNELISFPGLENSRAARFGQRLIAIAFGIKGLHGVIGAVLLMVFGVASVSAQTPTGSFFNGNSSQLGNSLRSVTFFLAAAMIIAGIIFIAVGIVTSGLRESLSTWKFITGAACFAFGGVCAAVYAFSQGDSVPLDNTF
jgi:hypothetical protein